MSADTSGPHFTVLCRYCVVLQIEGLCQPCLEQVYQLRCSSSIWSLPICVPHFGSFPDMSKSFIGILFALVTSLMSPFQMFWDTMNSTHEKQRNSRINAVCVLTAPPAVYSAHLSLPWPPSSLRHTTLKLGQ